MNLYCRSLRTDKEIEPFVDNILQIHDRNQKRYAINKIAAAERNMTAYSELQTLTHKDNRDFEFRDDKKREELRNQIYTELKDLERLKFDDDIELGKGGAKPPTGIKAEKKIFYLIGPPASGKSTIANTIADFAGAYILDSDYAKRKLPEYNNQISAASLVHDESDSLVFSYDNYNLLKYCIEKSYNMVIPKIGHNKESIIKFARKLKHFKYSVFLISIELDRVKATQRAYNRFNTSGRYVPLSLVFDYYANDPTLNYFKIKQLNYDIFDGYAQISTDVLKGNSPMLLECIGVDEIINTFGGK